MSAFVIYRTKNDVIDAIWDRDVPLASEWERVTPVAVVTHPSASLTRCEHTGWCGLDLAGRVVSASDVLNEDWSAESGVRVKHVIPQVQIPAADYECLSVEYEDDGTRQMLRVTPQGAIRLSLVLAEALQEWEAMEDDADKE